MISHSSKLTDSSFGNRRNGRSRLTSLGPLLLTGLLWCLAALPVRAALFESGGFKIYGDFRARLEADFDSQRADGSQRDDRTRVRIRARLGLDYTHDEHFSFGLRLRSGSDDSHQSPHITVLDFDDNSTGDADFNLDKWYLKAKVGKTWGWIGRNSLPYWRQNEELWDDDITPAGLGFGFSTGVGEHGELTLHGGYFSLPVGMKAFSGNLALGQVVLSEKIGEAGLTVAGGLLSIEANPDDLDASRLLRNNGFRDYQIWTASVQVKLKAGSLPLALGGDYVHNAESYSASDPDAVTAASFDQTDGYVLSAKLGDTKHKGHWLVGYYYANIEALAVNSSYTEDDWVRWGSAVETRATNLKGHELRFAYAFSKSSNLVARLYLVEAITNAEDGNRFRLDFNHRF